MAIAPAEGEDLVADNIPAIPATRRRTQAHHARRQAEKVVERFQWIGAGVVSVPLPVGSVGYSCCECADGSWQNLRL